MNTMRLGRKVVRLLEIDPKATTDEQQFKADVLQVIDHYRPKLSTDQLVEYLWHTIDNENEENHGKS